MNRIWLAANGGSGVLERLIAAGDVRIDRVKVGAWLGDATLIVTAAAHPVLLHVSDGVAWPRSHRWIEQQVRRSLWLRTPWVSAHLELGFSAPEYRRLSPRLFPPAISSRWAVSTLRRWAALSPVRLLVENMPQSHPSGHDYLVDPAFITQVVADADCHFLLDLAHARVTAAMRQQPVEEYLRRLPLDRLVEIHVSGPRHRGGAAGGRLLDSHESLQAEDLVLLEKVIHWARPEAVTLEYWSEPEVLKDQLQRLRLLLDSVP